MKFKRDKNDLKIGMNLNKPKQEHLFDDPQGFTFVIYTLLLHINGFHTRKKKKKQEKRSKNMDSNTNVVKEKKIGTFFINF